jgi:hypothetical protein
MGASGSYGVRASYDVQPCGTYRGVMNVTGDSSQSSSE